MSVETSLAEMVDQGYLTPDEEIEIMAYSTSEVAWHQMPPDLRQRLRWAHALATLDPDEETMH